MSTRSLLFLSQNRYLSLESDAVLFIPVYRASRRRIELLSYISLMICTEIQKNKYIESYSEDVQESMIAYLIHVLVRRFILIPSIKEVMEGAYVS